MYQPFDDPPLTDLAAAPLLTFTVDFDHPRRAVVRLCGEVDHFNSWVVSSLVEGTVLAGCDRVELDARDIVFTDSSLLSALEACAPALAQSGCSVGIIHPSASVLRLLELLQLPQLTADRPDDVARCPSPGTHDE